MHLDFQSSDLHERSHYVSLVSLPDLCPICHHAVHPKLVATRVHISGKSCDVALQCTRQSCQRMFIGAYEFWMKEGPYSKFRYRSSAPVSPAHQQFPDVIVNISPSFCEIYNQVESAEAGQLTQLVGIGLRKALEFLVKDFAISSAPDKEDDIRKCPLGPCIDKFIDDANVRQCAKRAVWLGNDEAHYVRKWEDRDIMDLKLLVKLTVNWVESSLLTQKYIAEMQPNA